MENKLFLTSQFDYNLPTGRIAKVPVSKRHKSKLLVAKQKTKEIRHDIFLNLSEYLPKNAVLVRNNTKVLPSRLLMLKPTGGQVEVFLIKPEIPYEYEKSLEKNHQVVWKTMIGGKVSKGMCLSQEILQAKIIDKKDQFALIQFTWASNFSFLKILENLAQIPLPPYIKRQPNSDDKKNYQTVYACSLGSVAAPTAGLHFSEKVEDRLKNKGIDFIDITLHIGPGTFKPISELQIQNHVMHSEKVLIKKDALEKLIKAIKAKRKIIAVGTTSMRALESLFWMSLRHKLSGRLENYLKQSEHLELAPRLKNFSLEESFTNILNHCAKSFAFNTSLMIAPPNYPFKTFDGLITNFHQPKSSLLVLVSAFLGIDFCREVYEEAYNHNYRFLSYGDASLLLR